MLNSLIKNLSKPLPGREVQYQMAPSDREDRFKKTADKKTIESAVMILLFEEKGELYTAFIQRPQYNGPHGGQISFPGGKYEAEADNNLQETAIRECLEEVGVNVRKENIIGELSDLHIPVSNFCVKPYVAFLEKPPKFVIDKTEVDEIIKVKIKDLLMPESKKIKPYNINNTEIIVPYFDIINKEIWGATAMILNELLTIISPCFQENKD